MNSDTTKITGRVRHIMFPEHDLSERKFPLPLQNLTRVRSFSFQNVETSVSLSSLDMLMSTFKCLRVLAIKGADFEELPSSVELDLLEGEGMQGIKNLRILRCTGFATIPEWLRNFTSLQKLELENCPLLCPSDGMRSLPPVQELRIKGSSNLSRICRREIDDAIDLQSEPDNHSYQWRAIHIPDDVSLDSDAYDLDIYLEHKDFETDSYDIGNMDDDKSEDTNSANSFSMPAC
ncbi:hypothetical protein LOK49_LG12G02606 [Camellia lanceoleosa]|uniref:Uncharacterized protein n=1 Tax=Camellia lanceoleosa TaxID=1840588 RepID=A0ACC0FQ14_9ERIC|nr:hypothetical protein LOK49_LG12G02606 [Camellia lanceoleosa]